MISRLSLFDPSRHFTSPRKVRANAWIRNGGSAVIFAGCHALNIRATKAHIGQLAIAELGQLSDIAPTFPERLDHADEQQRHW